MFNFLSYINLQLKAKKTLGYFGTAVQVLNGQTGQMIQKDSSQNSYSSLSSNYVMTSEGLCPVLGFQVYERHQFTGGTPSGWLWLQHVR